MPPATAYIMNAAIAALLGAGTNELAIITIVRYILPRKKGEIARRIQHLVSTDLLSPEKMQAKIDDPAVGTVMEKNIDDALRDFLARDLPCPDAILENHQSEADDLVARLRETALDEFSARISDDAFAADVLRPFLAARWRTLRDRTPASLFRTPAALPPALAEWVESLEDSEPLRSALARALDRRLEAWLREAESARDLLTPGLAAAAEEIVVSQAPAIIGELTNILRSPSVQATIADGIMHAVQTELRGQGVFGNLKGAFVNVIGIKRDIDGVCRRLPDSIEESFNHPARRHAFVYALRAAVAKGLARELDDDVRHPEKRARLVAVAMDALWRRPVFESLAAKLAGIADSVLHRTIGESLDRAGIDPDDDAVVAELTARLRRVLASRSTRDLLASQFDQAAAAWRRQPLGRLDRFVDDESRRRLAYTIAREGRAMLRERLSDFAEEAGMWDIITTSIENYDDKQIADLVQTLARSELRWVTVLGGVIGAVVGILQTVLQGWSVL